MALGLYDIIELMDVNVSCKTMKPYNMSFSSQEIQGPNILWKNCRLLKEATTGQNKVEAPFPILPSRPNCPFVPQGIMEFNLSFFGVYLWCSLA
jgi:hypothetical protein